MSETVTLVLHGSLGEYTGYELLRRGDEPMNFSDSVDEYAEILCVSEAEAEEIIEDTEFYSPGGGDADG